MTVCPWKNFCELSLDPNTAHSLLELSDNNKTATRVREEQLYPEHPDRFKYRMQLLCGTGLTGRCYWEVQWRGSVDIAVAYRRISGEGHRVDSYFGWSDQSWSLQCSEDGFSIWHNNTQTLLPQSWSSSSGTVAVYVDCAAGSLSFYNVFCDQLTHLHTFDTSFTQTLYPGFALSTLDSSVTLCASSQFSAMAQNSTF